MFFTSFDSEDEEETAENNTVDSAAVNDPTLSQDMFRQGYKYLFISIVFENENLIP